MNIRTLMVLAVALGLINPITAVITSAEHVKDTEPVLLTAMVIPWLIGAYLIRRGRISSGAILIGLLCVLDLVSAPMWKRTSALDWTTQSLAVAGAAAALATTVAVLVQRNRDVMVTGAVKTPSA